MCSLPAPRPPQAVLPDLPLGVKPSESIMVLGIGAEKGLRNPRLTYPTCMNM